MTDSPAKKLDFSSADKENVYKPIVGIPELVEDDASDVKPTVAPTIKAEEAHEPLLQENPGRFVLFPIKYHDVSHPLSRLSAVNACQHAPYHGYNDPC
jgi:ribonucleoside-diphosphate reductase subunit M2